MAGVVAWLATPGPRANRAVKFDNESGAALERNDYRAAYQSERFAYALNPTDERRLTLGSLAYLSQNYRQALRHFESISSQADPAVVAKSLLGAAAAAAKQGNDQAYQQARDDLANPSDGTLKVGLAFAALDIGNFDDLKSFSKNSPATNENAAYAKAVGIMSENPEAALEFLAGTPKNTLSIPKESPSFTAFLKELTTIRQNATSRERQTAQAMVGVASPATRQVLLAQMLQTLGEHRAARGAAKEAVTLVPDYRDGWNALAASQITLGEYQDAEKSLKTSIDLDDAFGYTWYLKSQLASAQDDSSKSDEYLKKAEGLGFK